MPINDQIVDADEPERRAFTNSSASVRRNAGLRTQEYLKRTPYVPWAPFAFERAVEIWQDAVSQQTGIIEQHGYYLAPLTGHHEYDGYVAAAGTIRARYYADEVSSLGRSGTTRVGTASMPAMPGKSVSASTLRAGRSGG